MHEGAVYRSRNTTLAYRQNTPFEILRTIAAHREPLAALDAADQNEVHTCDATIASLEARLSVGK